MGAWCAKAMGGEGSNHDTNIEGESNLIYACMLKIEVANANVKNFDSEWVSLFWNRMCEVIRDPIIGPPTNTTLRTWLDRSQPTSKGLLSNPIFDSC